MAEYKNGNYAKFLVFYGEKMWKYKNFLRQNFPCPNFSCLCQDGPLYTTDLSRYIHTYICID